MELSSRPVLMDLPEQPAQQKQAEPKGQRKLRTVDRQQTTMVTICVEDLVPADHKARAIWQFVGSMDLSRFSESLRTSQGCAGRPAWDPHFRLEEQADVTAFRKKMEEPEYRAIYRKRGEVAEFLA